MRTRLLILALAALAVSAPAADAHKACHHAHAHRCHRAKPKPKVWPNRVPEALADAERFWGGQPPCGAVTVDEKPLPPGPVNGGPEAERKIANGEDFVLAWVAEGGPCAINLNPESLWGVTQIQDEDWHWFCDTMTHELGHLFGHADEGQTDRSLITYPLVEPDAPNYNAVPECIPR